MKLLLVNASVVLVGQDYAPSVFTQDFLRRTKIAKKGWELVEPPIVTLTGALWKYSNGIAVAVDPNRIQVLDGNPPSTLADSEISSIATKLLNHLPYARHIAVGVNIVGFIEYENPLGILLDKFVKAGVWITDELNELSVGFVYPEDDKTLSLTYSVGVAQLAGEALQRRGIGITANYHTPITGNISLDGASREAKRQINRISEYQADYVQRIAQVFSLEGVHDDGNQ